jgi:uncharacterized protein (TIGR00730 family)
MKTVCVFCGHQTGNDAVFVGAARAMGEALARAGIGLVYGGGRYGMMGELAGAVLAHGGSVVGVIPEFLYTRGHGHEAVSLRRVPDMHTRKQTMYELADAFAALPGGIGTMEELFETLAWNQLGVHRKPCAVLNTSGYFDPVVEWLQRALTNGFVQGTDVDGLIVEEDPSELVRRLATAVSSVL